MQGQGSRRSPLEALAAWCVGCIRGVSRLHVVVRSSVQLDVFAAAPTQAWPTPQHHACNTTPAPVPQVRHLPRLVVGVAEALQEDRLSQADLSLLAPYQPSLSTAWLLQRAMAVRPGELAAPAVAQQQVQLAAAQAAPQVAQHGVQQTAQQQAAQQQQPGGGWLPPDQINRLLRCNFAVLRALGSWVLRPFLTDTFQALPLAVTMIGMSLR